MFDLERELSLNRISRMVEQQSQKRSLEQRQRDVYETHRHRTFAVAYYMTGNEVVAEEVLSDTFVSAFRRQEEPDAKIVDTAMVDQLRLRLPIDDVVESVDAADSPGLHGRQIRRTDIEEAVQELPASERIVFLLRDVEGYSPDNVAELLTLSASQVERTLFAARLRMRSVLSCAARRSAANEIIEAA